MNVALMILLQTYIGPASTLLAQSKFTQSGISMTTLLIGAGVLIGIGAVAWVGYQYFNPNVRKHSPKFLFRELCREHKLDFSEKALLGKLAARHQLATTAEVFVTPECFNINDGQAQPALLQQIDDLREKLFGAG